MKGMTIKNIKNNKTRERDQFTVVLESIQSDFRIFGEKLEFIDMRLDRMDEKFEKRFDEVDYKFEIVFDELHIIRNELKEKVGRDEFTLLEKRVMVLEKSRK